MSEMLEYFITGLPVIGICLIFVALIGLAVCGADSNNRLLQILSIGCLVLFLIGLTCYAGIMAS